MLGYTVEELEDRISTVELAEWIAFFMIREEDRKKRSPARGASTGRARGAKLQPDEDPPPSSMGRGKKRKGPP